MNTLRQFALGLLLGGTLVGSGFAAGNAPVATQDAQERRLDAMEAGLQQLGERAIRLESQLQNQGLLNLLNQVEALKSEVARLRGAYEEMVHAQQVADKRQKELFADLDERLKELANRPPPAPVDNVRLQSTPSLAVSDTPKPAPAQDPETESQVYEAALNLFKGGDYVAASTAFQAFLKDFPNGGLASNAHYWLGLSYFSLGDYKNAAASQLRLLKDYPLSPKVPDAMVSLARAQTQMGEVEAARATLEQVLAKYPAAKAAEAARKVLALLK